MSFLIATLLGVVEGITEFLPISSTGHMIIVEHYLPLTPDEAFNDAFTIAIQLPAIFAVVVLFWKKMWPFGKGADTQGTIVLWTKVVVGFLPAAVIGLLMKKKIELYLFNPTTVAIALIVGGIILIVLDRGKRVPRINTIAEIGFGMALAIGFFQCLGMIPGTSRAAATIVGAMLLGASRPAAAEFSFFLAVPTMLGATTVALAKTHLHFTHEQWMLLGVGSVVSFVVAYAVVAGFIHYIQRHTFQAFGYYRVVLGAAVLLLVLFAGLHT